MIDTLYNELEKIGLFRTPTFKTVPSINNYAMYTNEDDNIVIEIEMPGTEKESIELSYEDSILKVSAKRAVPKYTKLITNINKSEEISHAFKVPSDKVAEIGATYENGILYIELKKSEKAKPKKIKVL